MEKKSDSNSYVNKCVDKSAFLEFCNNIKKSFDMVKHELDEHRDVINENTAETEEAFDAVAELDQKIQKIDERVAELQMLIKHLVEGSSTKKTSYILSKYEQKVFTLLYTEEDDALTITDIAVRLNLSELIVKAALSSLAKKGIPLLKADINHRTYFKLDHDFKELQAKENILNLNHKKRLLRDKKLTSFNF